MERKFDLHDSSIARYSHLPLIHVPIHPVQPDKRLGKFLHIIRDSPVYPVIYDAKRRVCSLPPIINSEHSKIKLTTKNVFIEITATDEYKANVVLNTLVCMFSEYCDEKFT